MDDPAHLRTISRLTSEYLIGLVAEMIRETGLDPVDMLVLNAIGAANVAHLRDRQDLTADYQAPDAPLPIEMKRPITSLAIAESLGLPRETVRRRVAGLIKSGQLMRQKGGLIATPELQNPERTVALAFSNAQLFRRMIRQMRQHGVEI